MLSSVYAEDIFIGFHDRVIMGVLSVQHTDYSPILSFGQKIINNEQLTLNQANYILKILEKYKTISVSANYDYSSILGNLQWKMPFRVLDLTKKIYVELQDNSLQVCLKFPYQLKKEFDDEIENWTNSSLWDHTDKVRRVNLYDCNLIHLYEFAIRHNFEIDDSFMLAVGEVEEIWQNAENIAPYSTMAHYGVSIHNAGEDVIEYWDNKAIGTYQDNLLLAKSMGYVFDQTPKNIVEKIAAFPGNSFWIKNNQDLFSIYETITGKICVVLDRAANPITWLQNFVADADKNGISREDIRVCFRDSKDNASGLNEWIKLAGVGGKVDTGRILIFETKPAKWLFKDIDDVKILATNNIYPPTNPLTRDWFQSHPCVIYLGSIKPSEQKGKKIVEL